MSSYLNDPGTLACVTTQPEICNDVGYAPRNTPGSLRSSATCTPRAATRPRPRTGTGSGWRSRRGGTTPYRFLSELQERVGRPSISGVALFRDADPGNDPTVIGAGPQACAVVPRALAGLIAAGRPASSAGSCSLNCWRAAGSWPRYVVVVLPQALLLLRRQGLEALEAILVELLPLLRQLLVALVVLPRAPLLLGRELLPGASRPHCAAAGAAASRMASSAPPSGDIIRSTGRRRCPSSVVVWMASKCWSFSMLRSIGQVDEEIGRERPALAAARLGMLRRGAPSRRALRRGRRGRGDASPRRAHPRGVDAGRLDRRLHRRAPRQRAATAARRRARARRARSQRRRRAVPDHRRRPRRAGPDGACPARAAAAAARRGSACPACRSSAA